MDTVSREAKIYVRNKSDRKIFYIEEKYSSLVWTERYQESGDFVLDIPLNSANFDVYKIGNYISFDNSEESMIIEGRTINDEVEEPTLEITGRSLSSILLRRVNASKILDIQNGDLTYSGKVGEVVQSIFDDEIIDPKLPYFDYMKDVDNGLVAGSDHLVLGINENDKRWSSFLAYNAIKKFYEEVEYRKIPKFIFKNSVDSNLEITTNFSKIETIYDIIVKMSKNNYLGFKSYFDDSLNIVIELYSGVDRTSSQKTLDPVIFDPAMDNISYLGYVEDATDYKNTGFTYSDGHLFYRSKYPLGMLPYPRYDIYLGYTWNDFSGETKTGLDRFEIPFDARSEVSVNDLKDNVNPELYYGEDSEESEGSEVSTSGWSSSEWYDWYDKIQQSVKNFGISSYEEGEYGFIQSSEGSIDPLVRYKFEEDYNIGDKVDITNGDYGIAMTAYIDEAVKSYDSNGWIITPNFKNILDYDYGEEEDQ